MQKLYRPNVWIYMCVYLLLSVVNLFSGLVILASIVFMDPMLPVCMYIYIYIWLFDGNISNVLANVCTVGAMMNVLTTTTTTTSHMPRKCYAQL